MIKSNLPVILLKKLVLLPGEEVRVEIKSDISKKVTEISKLYHDDEVLIVCPLNTLEEKPDTSDLSRIGVVGKINSVIDLPNGNKRVIITGLYRVKIISYVNYSNEEDILDSIITSIDLSESEIEWTAYQRKLQAELEQYIDKNPLIGNSIMSELKSGCNLDKMTDLIANFLPLSFEKKLNLMLDSSPISRCKTLIKELAVETAVIDLESHIENEIKKGLDDTQKEFILKEKLRVIKDELGETNTKEEDILNYRNLANSGKYPERIKEKLLSEIERYNATSEMSPDAGIIRNYIEYLLNVPWYIETKDEKDLLKIEKKLNDTHYGMKKAKERVIEYIAVKSIANEVSSPIICLVGPPGVGKTTFAESISQALNRNFVKISLGGMSDSAELVGHRRAYIGSNPGKIVTSLIKCGSNNPVFLLDEVDKLKKDYKGDPASTLLDILDVSQNKRFTDNYIDEEIDLSKILFILTANDITNIPPTLLDRLEIIELTGYTDSEKLFISENYLIPTSLRKHGLKNTIIKFEEPAIKKIINEYTSESGVRELERDINKIVRKVITEHIKSSRKIVSIRIKENDINHFLEQELYKESKYKEIIHPGVVTAVACSTVGGVSIYIECTTFKGTGKYTFTGSLGDMTKESIEIAISYIKSNAKRFDIDEDFFVNNDIHINFTEGAINKDGPSAGIAVVTAILSHIKGTIISDKISLTGEITLNGDILKIGGLKEKTIACERLKLEKLFIPKDNMNDIEWLEKDLRNNIEFVPVSNYLEIYEKIFS
ncbi:MAG: endopeptidase La [Tenericutes bacterium]|nr:endopeptidase La [Mycoplasmatota bacterium]